jgi:CDP-diacylglycerol--serine O-phosphatidyltransferase
MMSQNESGETPLPLDAPGPAPGRRRLNVREALHGRGAGDSGPLRRGVYLLPSLFTLGNLFCGYACVMYAMRGDINTAAPFIGVAVVLDMLDGRIARLTGTSSPFGREFDSLADVVSFGVAPAILAYAWGLQPLHRLGWATGFIFVTAAAMRLARFNIQSVTATDKRYFAGMPSPAAAAVPASTVYFYPEGFSDPRGAVVALLVVLVPALLMVSTIRFRSFKTIDLRARRPYKVLALLAMVIALVQLEPRIVLILIAYVYLVSAFIEMAWARLRRRPSVPREKLGDTTAPSP